MNTYTFTRENTPDRRSVAGRMCAAIREVTGDDDDSGWAGWRSSGRACPRRAAWGQGVFDDSPAVCVTWKRAVGVSPCLLPPLPPLPPKTTKSAPPTLR